MAFPPTPAQKHDLFKCGQTAACAQIPDTQAPAKPANPQKKNNFNAKPRAEGRRAWLAEKSSA